MRGLIAYSKNSLVLLALAAAVPSVHAMSCGSLSMALDDAKTQLRRAANAGDLDEGHTYARRAKNALEDLATAAMDCQCNMAHMEFDDAATKAKRARDADDGREYVNQINRSISRFNDGLMQLRMCAGERQSKTR